MAFNAPCKGCAERFVGCHSKCEKYAEFKAIIDEQNAQKRIANDANAATFEGHRRVEKDAGSLSHTRSWYVAQGRRVKKRG